MSDSTRLIYGTFFVSLFVHLCVLFIFYSTNLFDFKKTRTKFVEVSLQPRIPPQKAVPSVEAKILPKKETIYQPKEIERKEILKGILGQKAPKSPSNLNIFERKTEKVIELNVVKKAYIDLIDSEKIDSPVYTLNKQLIASAYSKVINKNYAKSSQAVGTVNLSFMLSRDGELLQVKIIEEKSSSNEELRRLSVDSLKETRFFSLAKYFNVSEITFNIQVSFAPIKE